jgi:hypothetical protein
LVELKVKEYPEPAPEDFKTIAKGPGGSISIAPIPEKPVNAPISASNLENDKLPVQQEKAPENENSAKITAVNELLEQNDF